MKFLCLFIGLLYGLFSIARFVWPDPDGSLNDTNKREFDEIILRTKEKSAVGVVFKALLPLVYAFYLPFYRPVIGFFLAIGLIVVSFSI